MRVPCARRVSMPAVRYVHEPDPDPRDVSDAVGRRVVAEGGTQGEALAAAFDVLAAAAQRGDRRVRL